ncbi:MAG TPA: helix-turn-helix transcriptional regulator [Candidatus Obscuribacterales bacterium]
MKQHNYDPLIDRVAKVLISRRQQLSISQEQLAQRSGLHRTYISDIERGSRNMSLQTLGRLAAALDVKPWQVLALADENASSS